ncbi:uncharacterized protein J3D65DRAFT_605941 [Phyllosticta citribraziliensis]|uniref:F-box domain-containing protein n=1 Tax=Phyllosticta citribraziliensis TaxID=989973 RepID=A0ABR1LBD1_9PEZI
MSFQAPSEKPFSSKTTRYPVFPILKLPNEILLKVADEVANADTDDTIQRRGRRPKRTLMALSLVNKRLRSVCVERMFKTLSLLRKSEGRNQGLFQFYSGISQGNPMPHIAPFHERFGNAPLHLFSRLECFAVHQFWQFTPNDFIWIPRTLMSIMDSSNMLRCLHIDGGWSLAISLESEMNRRPVNLANVKEIVLSLEMCFLLQYTPNVERLSNKPYSGSGLNYRQRFYNEEQVSQFFAVCQSLPKLKNMELTAVDFQGHSRFHLPRMSLETLTISSDTVRSEHSPLNASESVPLEDILRCIQKQPHLVEIRIPLPERVEMDFAEYVEQVDERSDILPAAIIAVVAPKIQRIHVGRTSIFDVVKVKGKTIGFKHSTYFVPADQIELPLEVVKPICLQDEWDSWKEPLVYAQLQCAVPSEIFLDLEFAYGDDEERTTLRSHRGSAFPHHSKICPREVFGTVMKPFSLQGPKESTLERPTIRTTGGGLLEMSTCSQPAQLPPSSPASKSSRWKTPTHPSEENIPPDAAQLRREADERNTPSIITNPANPTRSSSGSTNTTTASFQKTRSTSRKATKRKRSLQTPHVNKIWGCVSWNLSFHKFWHTFGCTRLEDTCAMKMIAKGLRLMIEAPKKLRRLHIDGEKYFAQYMRRELQSSPAARAALANLDEIVFSIEFDFMLQYTPNVSRLSNNTLMSRTTGASSDVLRRYSMKQVTRFFGLCSRLPRLIEMELNIDSFKGPAFSRAVLPTMGLQKLAVAREVVQSCEDYQVDRGFGDPIPLGVLLNMARSQPNLREFRIPETDLVMIGAFEVEIEWPPSGQIVDMLPAAIIAAKVPNLRSIHVGKNVTVDVLHDGLGMRHLRMMSDNLEPETRRSQRPRPRPGFPYQPFGSDLWIHKWDSWKEPVVARNRHWTARREIWAELPLHINYYGNFQYPAFIEMAMDTDGRWKHTAVVVNMNHELIEMRDEGDIP